jgi:hypothetical protein
VILALLGLAVLLAVVILALRAVDTPIVLALITLLTSLVAAVKETAVRNDRTARGPRPPPRSSRKADKRSSTSPIHDAAGEDERAAVPEEEEL